MTLHKVSFKLDLFGEFFFLLIRLLFSFFRSRSPFLSFCCLTMWKARDFYFISKHLFPFKIFVVYFLTFNSPHIHSIFHLLLHDHIFLLICRNDSMAIHIHMSGKWNTKYDMNIFYNKVCIMHNKSSDE